MMTTMSISLKQEEKELIKKIAAREKRSASAALVFAFKDYARRRLLP